MWEDLSLIDAYQAVAKEIGCQSQIEFSEECFGSPSSIMYRLVDGLAEDDLTSIEMCIRFYEECPMYVGSGRHRERIARKLKHVTLTDNQQARLREVFKSFINKRFIKAEMKDFVKLVKCYSNEDLENFCRKRVNIANPYVKKYCEYILNSD
ncbi:MAG: hypothetical protein COA78_18735 [Blastopirellula sp.]|nr:MAG: hypothetical protein COA78_18735 [Blastopirellula sp.]